MDIITLLEDDPKQFKHYYNIYLVTQGALPSIIIDPYTNDTVDVNESNTLVDIVIKFGLVYIDIYGSYLITRPDNVKNLEFIRDDSMKSLRNDLDLCQNLFDKSEPKHVVKIYAGEHEVYTKVCPRTKDLKSRVRRLKSMFKHAMPTEINQRWPLRYKIEKRS